MEEHDYSNQTINKQQTGTLGVAMQASRQSGKGALLEAVHRIRTRADHLEALARAIPDNFPADADAGLWELVIFADRR